MASRGQFDRGTPLFVRPEWCAAFLCARKEVLPVIGLAADRYIL